MNAIRSGVYTALALGVALACGKDPVSRAADDPASDLRASASSNSSRNDSDNDGHKIAILDDCDPNDPAWAPTGGCLRKEGHVTNAEFSALVRSPLSLSTVGHPAWRNQPAYLVIEEGRDVEVTNDGGRTHTLTEVAQFGGGRVPPLNVGLVPAPECASAVNLAPGDRATLSNLGVGIHRFQCCIHPWMRELVKVEEQHAH
jgi:plastocyanin